MKESHIKRLERMVQNHGHAHVYMDDGRQVEPFRGNTTFYDDHFEIDDGSTVHLYSYGHVLKVVKPMKAEE